MVWIKASSVNNVLAMILAGGKGKRMGLLCHMELKPILFFAGGFRVIDFSLSNCINSGINTIAVLVNRQQQSISDYLHQWYRFNGEHGKLHILEPRNTSYKGTADAAYQNLDFIKAAKPDAVLVLAADHVYKMDYLKMFQFHRQMDADVTIGVVNVPIEQAHRFGIVSLNESKQIMNFVEKPMLPKSNLASMGIYIFNNQILFDHLIKDSTQDSLHDFGQTIMNEVVRNNRVFAYTFEGYWQDIGTVETYYLAHMELISEFSSLGTDDHWSILTGSEISSASRLPYGDNIRNSIISPGCIIRGQVENSILSPSVIVEKKAFVKNSIIMANTVIGEYSVVEHCILGEAVIVGKSCYVGPRYYPTQNSQGIIVIVKDLVIPDYSVINRSFGAPINKTSLAHFFMKFENAFFDLRFNEDRRVKNKQEVKKMERISEQEAQKFLSDVPEEHVFRCCDGRTINNLTQLEEVLVTMSDDTYRYHANLEKNDFSNWVQDIIGDNQLSKDLRNAKNHSKALASVKRRVRFLQGQLYS